MPNNEDTIILGYDMQPLSDPYMLVIMPDNHIIRRECDKIHDFKWMYEVIGCTTIEHYQGQIGGYPAHIFCDEEGLMKEPKAPNYFASLVYWQAGGIPGHVCVGIHLAYVNLKWE